MSNQESVCEKKRLKRREDRTFASVLFSILGTLMIFAVLITCIPAAVPRLFGYEIYNIVSGSMEPDIPVGSAVYVKSQPIREYREGDVIAFFMNDSIMVHRLVWIDEANREFHTKGDANAGEDLNPIPYSNVIGKMQYHLPYIGNLMILYSTLMGKIYVICFLFVGILLHMISGMLVRMKRIQLGKERRGNDKKEAESRSNSEQSQTVEESVSESDEKEVDEITLKKKKRAYFWMKILMVLFAVCLIVVVGMIIKLWRPYYDAKKNYEKAAEQFITAVSEPKEAYGEADLEATGEEETEGGCPISVDFAALQEINPEVVAWIYCEDTVINYPICRGEDNDYYLRHTYDHKEIKSGCIFLETANAGDFSDSNSIIYGHHMKDGSMFSSLSKWADQSYYEEHPYMWLLTPDGNYRLDLFGGYVTSAISSTYTVFQKPGDELLSYISSISGISNFKAKEGVLPDELTLQEVQDKRFIVLSTCDYSFQNARYVLHGVLVPVP